MKDHIQPANQDAYLAAIVHFPKNEAIIGRLMTTDFAFRSICEELSATKMALAHRSGPYDPYGREQRDERIGCLVGHILSFVLSHQTVSRRDHSDTTDWAAHGLQRSCGELGLTAN